MIRTLGVFLVLGLALLLPLGLTGCASWFPTRTITLPPQVVKVPVPVACAAKTPPEAPKVYSDADLAAMDDYSLVIALRINAEALAAYARELEAVHRACQ